METETKSYRVSSSRRIHRSDADCYGAMRPWTVETSTDADRPCRNCLPHGLIVRVS